MAQALGYSASLLENKLILSYPCSLILPTYTLIHKHSAGIKHIDLRDHMIRSSSVYRRACISKLNKLGKQGPLALKKIHSVKQAHLSGISSPGFQKQKYFFSIPLIGHTTH